VNRLTAFTGVEASLIDPANASSGLVFTSSRFGSEAFVAVERIDRPQSAAIDQFKLFKFDPGTQLGDYGDPGVDFPWGNVTTGGAPTPPLRSGAVRDIGQDVAALVNGNLATGRGLEIKLSSPDLGIELLLDQDFATRPGGGSTTFFVTSGGSTFQLGPSITPLQQTNIGIQSVAASQLGGTLINGNLQFLSSLKDGQGNSIRDALDRGDFTPSQEILRAAIDEISVLRGRLGAFERNILEPNVRSLQAAVENLSASESRIRDADFAFETSRLTRAQILASSGTTVLGLANQQSQQVLQLLG
jgi:flagellin